MELGEAMSDKYISIVIAYSNGINGRGIFLADFFYQTTTDSQAIEDCLKASRSDLLADIPTAEIENIILMDITAKIAILEDVHD
jgi:hypothetical protein